MKKLLLLLTPFALFSCEKAIDITPASLKPLLVVDGTIEDGQPPNIVLANSINYFSTIDARLLTGSFVQDAVVTLTDGRKTEKLKAYKTPIGGGYNLVHYSSDSSNLANAIVGKQGSIYTLTIEHNGDKYEARTSIPVLTKTIDSLWWIKSPSIVDTLEVLLMSRVKDPAGYGNYVRYFSKVNRSRYFAPFNSVYDDQVIDGKTYEVQVEHGVDRNQGLPSGENDYFKRGDTVTVKLTNIDKATYDFWRTVEFGYQSVGNPFASPTKVLGNVSNGALGAFCCYSVQYKSLIIPK
ncbi:MAG: hypothetical protein JWQ96_1515 [Segetibacter sp.]|nr:hypothetical protein [Segetibacter sp.]